MQCQIRSAAGTHAESQEAYLPVCYDQHWCKKLGGGGGGGGGGMSHPLYVVPVKWLADLHIKFIYSIMAEYAMALHVPRPLLLTGRYESSYLAGNIMGHF